VKTAQAEPDPRFGQVLLPGTRMIPLSDRHGIWVLPKACPAG
jgi:hypothetical protein